MDLYWEDDYAIAVALKHAHPTADPLDIDWITLHQWVVNLPGFADDQSVTAQYLLENIQREWYEEVASHESSEPFPNDPMVPPELSNNVFISTIDKFYNWGRKRSMWPMMFGLACCAIEMICVAAGRYDLERFGAGLMRPSPRQADLMIVSGTVTKKMVPTIVRLYNQMPEPKYVLAMGACATSGGPFKEGYNVVSGIDKFLPVDVYIPGCPPKPEALLHGFLKLFEKIESQSIRDVAWYRKTAIEAIPIPVLGPDLIDPRRAVEIREMSKPQAEPVAEPAQA